MMFAITSVQFLNAQESKSKLLNFDPKPKPVTFKVYGECSMCKHRIENALKVDGIKSASWNVDTKILTVQYVLTADITGENKIHELIASVGHDTDKYKASNEVYNNLPGCCHYERAKANN